MANLKQNINLNSDQGTLGQSPIVDNKDLTPTVCIIGAGVVGCAIARELSRYQLKVCVLEKEDDVAAGATKANSGIVHGGYDDKSGSLHAKFCARGNYLYRELNRQLNFGFKEVGSLVVAFDQNEEATLAELYAQGQKNGVAGLEVVEGEFVRKIEPNLAETISAALYCRSAGITSPYEFAIALMENAVTNGVQLFLNTAVTNIEKRGEEFFIKVKGEEGEKEPQIFRAKHVINAAGIYADDIAKMAGVASFTLNPRRGQYLLFDKDQGSLVNTVVFQTPTARGKGVLVTPTLHGNLLIGPDATDDNDKDDVATAPENLANILATARRSLPNFNAQKVITNFAGNRAIPVGNNDFIIGESEVKNFINAAGIASPGLTSAPAIAEYVVELLGRSGTILKPKSDFNPERRALVAVKDLPTAEAQKLIAQNPSYGRVICRCETVTEGEVIAALSGNIPINSVDALKRRVRAGMGRCQSGFCLPRLLEIIHREKKLPYEKITKKGTGSEVLV